MSSYSFPPDYFGRRGVSVSGPVSFSTGWNASYDAEYYPSYRRLGRGGGGGDSNWPQNGGGPIGVGSPRVQEITNDPNECDTPGGHANDDEDKNDNESDISSPQLQLPPQSIEESGEQSNTKAQIPGPVRYSSNPINTSFQVTAQGLIGPVYLLTPVIKLPQVFTRRNDHVHTGEGNADLSRLEAGETNDLSHPLLDWHQTWPIHNTQSQQDAGESGFTTSPAREAICASTIVRSDSVVAARRSPIRLACNKKPCYYLLICLGTGIVVSLTLALWWMRSQGDLSAAFTLGSYVVGVDALMVTAAGVFHAPSCRCWAPSIKSEDESR